MDSDRFTERPLVRDSPCFYNASISIFNIIVLFQMMALMEILCNSVPEVNARLSVLTSSFFARAVSLFVHTG